MRASTSAFAEASFDPIARAGGIWADAGAAARTRVARQSQANVMRSFMNPRKVPELAADAQARCAPQGDHIGGRLSTPAGHPFSCQPAEALCHITVPVKAKTGSPFWFTAVLCWVTSPQPGRDAEGRASTICTV